MGFPHIDHLVARHRLTCGGMRQIAFPSGPPTDSVRQPNSNLLYTRRTESSAVKPTNAASLPPDLMSISIHRPPGLSPRASRPSACGSFLGCCRRRRGHLRSALWTTHRPVIAWPAICHRQDSNEENCRNGSDGRSVGWLTDGFRSSATTARRTRRGNGTRPVEIPPQLAYRIIVAPSSLAPDPLSVCLSAADDGLDRSAHAVRLQSIH